MFAEQHLRFIDMSLADRITISTRTHYDKPTTSQSLHCRTHGANCHVYSGSRPTDSLVPEGEQSYPKIRDLNTSCKSWQMQ